MASASVDICLTNQQSLDPVLRDNISTALEKFGHLLAHFEFDNAKECLESFRLSTFLVANVSDPMEFAWLGLINCLLQLSQAEKAYFALSFLLPKGFMRKEHVLKANYNLIRTEMARISDSVKSGRFKTGDEQKQSLIEHLLTQFHNYLSARIDLMNFYEKLTTIPLAKGLDLVQCIAMLKDLQKKHVGNFSHPLVSNLESSFNYETEILCLLLECQDNLCHLRFLPSLLGLVDSQSRLSKWLGSTEFKALETKSNWWFSLGSNQKQHTSLSLCIWMQQFHDKLISKFSLYFNETLCVQNPGPEWRLALNKCAYNHPSKFTKFFHKYDTQHICIILNSREEPEFEAIGYNFPSNEEMPSKLKDGVESYPFIFSVPMDKPSLLHPSIIMIIEKYETRWRENPEIIVTEFDDKKGLTFLARKIEGNLYMVMIFLSSSKAEKDGSIINFMHEQCNLLTSNKTFAALKVPPK